MLLKAALYKAIQMLDLRTVNEYIKVGVLFDGTVLEPRGLACITCREHAHSHVCIFVPCALPSVVLSMLIDHLIGLR